MHDFLGLFFGLGLVPMIPPLHMGLCVFLQWRWLFPVKQFLNLSVVPVRLAVAQMPPWAPVRLCCIAEPVGDVEEYLVPVVGDDENDARLGFLGSVLLGTCWVVRGLPQHRKVPVVAPGQLMPH